MTLPFPIPHLMFLDFFVISVYDIVALESFWCRACSCISSWLRTSSLSSCCCASLLIHLCEEKTCQRDQKKSGECDTDQSESDRDTDGEL